MGINDEKNPESSNDAFETVGERATPLLERIKETLSATPPERWEAVSDELDTQRKYEKSRPTWEEFYCTDIKTGVLVIRSSTPVKANYYSGGYFFAEAGLPQYSVEIRPKGWTPKMLSDPFFRSTSGIERKIQTLVESELARQLFTQIKESVRKFQVSVRRDFENAVEHISPRLLALVHETGSGDWETLTAENNRTAYAGELEAMKIEVSCVVKDASALYGLKLSKYGLVWDSKDLVLAREVFKAVDDCVKHASLEKLGKVLEEMF